jgi:hypothetical protein
MNRYLRGNLFMSFSTPKTSNLQEEVPVAIHQTRRKIKLFYFQEALCNGIEMTNRTDQRQFLSSTMQHLQMMREAPRENHRAVTVSKKWQNFLVNIS